MPHFEMVGERTRTTLPAGRGGVLLGVLLLSTGCDAVLDRLESLVGAPTTASSHGGITSLDDESHARRLYYQFVDDRGRVHFVQRLDAVPAAWRSTMGYVEMDVPPPLSPLDAQAARSRQAASRASRAGRTAKASGVVLYSATWCGACRKAKKYLERKHVRYELRDVDDPANLELLLETTGRKGIPVLDVGGRIVTGFSPQSYDELLSI